MEERAVGTSRPTNSARWSSPEMHPPGDVKLCLLASSCTEVTELVWTRLLLLLCDFYIYYKEQVSGR